ncbi:MAG: class I SAM-dependent methyltransferase [Rhodobacteraceae bacterium]|nr:MAG: class I SAM-dependent methyltransferase [Paracoccaceae bacterium]
MSAPPQQIAPAPQGSALRPCPDCGGKDLVALPRCSRDEWQVCRCGDCGFVFLGNPIEYAALEEDFAWETTFWAEDARRAGARGPLRRLAARVRGLGYRLRGDGIMRRYHRLLGPGRILDIGCGDVVRFDAPFVPHGIELSRALAAKADAIMRARGGECLQGPGAERIFDWPEGYFDSVMMHSYLEHETDYPRLLAGCLRALRPGGRAFIRVPNFAALNRMASGNRWAGFRYPDHVNYFTPATLRRAVERAGFHFKLVNRHKIWLDDNIQALAIKPAQT